MPDWFESKPDHPMSSVAETRALLADLPKDPQKALEDLTSSLASVSETPGFRVDVRMQVLGLLDETAQPLERAVFGLYLAKPQLRHGPGVAQWQLVHDFWSQLASACAVCRHEYQAGAKGAAAAKDALALVLAREIRALGQRMKLLAMRYRPLDASPWSALHEACAFAESSGHFARGVSAYPNESIGTSVRAEFAKVLMLHMIDMQSLSVSKIELASRIIYRFASLFVLEPERAAGTTFVVDLSAPKPPRRASIDDAPGPALRFFGMGGAAAKLEEMITQNEQGLLVEEQRLGKEFSAGEKLTVLRRLLHYWSPNPPQRAETWTKVSGQLSVVHGYNAVCRYITNIDASSMGEINDDMEVQARKRTGLGLTAEAVEQAPEVWLQQSASELSVGAVVPPNTGTWVAVGSMCAIRPAGESRWWAGVVQRVRCDEKNRVGAAIEILARKPVAVWLRALGREEEKASDWETTSGSFSYEYLHAVMLTDHAKAHDRPVLLLVKNKFIPGQIYEMMVGDKSRHVLLKEFLEQGEDYDLGSFEWYQGQAAGPGA